MQSQTAASHPVPALDSSLVTVNVIALNGKTSNILPNLQREDFRLSDNGHDMPIASFGSGAHYSVSPVALWLVLECNNFGQVDFASAFMRGKTQYLLPALGRLDKTDAVGVAHWCGDGTQAIDLPPSQDPNAAVGKLDDLLKRKAIEGTNRQSEDAMQRMVAMILANTQNAQPRRLPVLVFLYGDAGFAFEYEADAVLRDLLSTSSMAYGLNNAGYHFDPKAMFGGGQIYYEIHYLSSATGGNVYGTPDPKRLSQALDYILMQMHFRYTLGFKPSSWDGKKHDLKVDLTPDGQKKYADAVLRYRAQYIAVPPLSKSAQ
ncbi:MAG TPA: hypothetical protein VFW25_05585 [Silvibacterium sp.]|nr:hypothetical protein [Silvibacterium sp.]